ncbi:hypothetical protein CYV15_07420 [Riemerella anatipestifer]|uniref:Uncharacterized protein n=2 Tax=Riemerella anatipestifer TaxID=34085 RepID=A0A1S7DVR3_RIEAN|nr:hypothetical protein AB406_2260 [Riemerella anatipestifer]PST43997.1 hypothetical protein CYV15_07420 [Riemerella anatipestifer]
MGVDNMAGISNDINLVMFYSKMLFTSTILFNLVTVKKYSYMKLRNLIIFSILVLMNSCSTQLTTLPNGKQVDKRFVGTWTGSENGQQIDGMSKSWEMKRFEDGTFILDFTYTQFGESENLQETGNWWVENGKFNEFHDESGKTDVYQYEIINKNQIRFISESISVDMNTDKYEFVDTRKATNLNDGKSIENAIKVNSVAEEYEFVEKNCPNCKLINQVLTEHNGIPYDILNLEKNDGTKISFYFNIKSFYGKF